MNRLIGPIVTEDEIAVKKDEIEQRRFSPTVRSPGSRFLVYRSGEIGYNGETIRGVHRMDKKELVFAADIHGEFETLARLLSPDDTLFVAGDLLNFMDFADITKGILWHAFTPEELAEGLKEYAQGNFAKVRDGIREVSTPGESRYEKVRPLIEETYERFSRMLPCPAYIIYGNDDYPEILKSRLDDRARLIESGVVSAGGIRVGLVSGMPGGRRGMGLPGEAAAEAYRERISSLGPVDVVVTHVPPSVEELAYDVVVSRDEPASTALVDYIRHHRPAWAFFGHVHNPKQREAVIGRTRALNLGFFKKTKTILRLDPKTMEIRETGT
jgi:Icc-related predicted phosphoesterase